MAQSREEKLAYARGYNRCRASHSERVQKCLAIAKLYRERSKLPTDNRACSGCARWLRGGGEPNAQNCLWGKCETGFEAFMEPRMWADSFVGEKTQRAIITSQDFSCSNWLPRSAEHASASIGCSTP